MVAFFFVGCIVAVMGQAINFEDVTREEYGLLMVGLDLYVKYGPAGDAALDAALLARNQAAAKRLRDRIVARRLEAAKRGDKLALVVE